MTDDRAPFREARLAGKAIHQAQRLARAQTVIGELGQSALVQSVGGLIRLRVGDEIGDEYAAMKLTPEAAVRLAAILTKAASAIEETP